MRFVRRWRARARGGCRWTDELSELLATEAGNTLLTLTLTVTVTLTLTLTLTLSLSLGNSRVPS